MPQKNTNKNIFECGNFRSFADLLFDNKLTITYYPYTHET